MTSPQPSSNAIPETPPGNTNHQPPPVVSSPIQEEKEESSSAATHNARALISKDSSKTKSTAAAEDFWHPLPCSPHRQREMATNTSTHTMDPCHASPTNGVSLISSCLYWISLSFFVSIVTSDSSIHSSIHPSVATAKSHEIRSRARCGFLYLVYAIV
jgi:hypothetical protein